MSKAIALLPTSIGASLGVYLLLFPSQWKLMSLGGVSVSLLGLLWLARKAFRRAPVMWAWVLESWCLFLPSVTALAVFFLLWSTIKADAGPLVPLSGWSAGQKADLVKYLAGIATGLAAALVADDPDKNFFWTAFQFQQAAKTAGPFDVLKDRRRYEAAGTYRIRDNSIKGWGFLARRQRAKDLAGPSLLASAPTASTANQAPPAHIEPQVVAGAAARRKPARKRPKSS